LGDPKQFLYQIPYRVEGVLKNIFLKNCIISVIGQNLNAAFRKAKHYANGKIKQMRYDKQEISLRIRATKPKKRRFL